MASISDELCGLIAADFCAPRRYFHFQNNRPEDRVMFALVRMGFLTPASDESSTYGPFEPALDVDSATGFALHSLSMNEEDKQALLDAAICYEGDCKDLPVTRGWFKAPDRSLNFMQFMASFGYAETNGDQFRWTERIGPSMRWSNFWDDAGRSVDDGP